jgi:acetyltransferase-like isoleucine patch superfamily enzyme
MISAVLNLIRATYSRIRLAAELRHYNEFTIAEYLRKQGAEIGEGCSIISRDLGPEPYLVKLGNHVTIAHGVIFMTHDGGAWLFRQEFPDLQVFGPIVIEDNCVIGINAVLCPNIRIGPNSIVAAGSVVISDVPPNTIAMGVPARPLGSIDKYREKCLERWNQQRPPGIVIEPGATWWNSKHLGQNREKLRRHLTALFRDQMRQSSGNLSVSMSSLNSTIR